MDESIERNLDSQHRQLAAVEARLEALLAGEMPDEPLPIPSTSGPQSYAQLTEYNDRLRVINGWNDIDLDAALTTDERARLELWRSRQRIEWDSRDLIAVGFAGVVGIAATWFDSSVDGQVRRVLAGLKESELVRGWERDGKRLPIDYMGPGFGGRAHRVRSAGHDLARPLEALWQIKNGTFRGTRWADHVRQPVEVAQANFQEVGTYGEALTLWMKHLGADFVTPMGLPMPGSSYLCDLDNRQLRTFAHTVYEGSSIGNGLNVRSGVLTPSLSVLSTEVIIRTHVHGRIFTQTGSAALDPAQQALRTELLLATHSLVGAASLGKTVSRALLLEKSPTAIRHLNIPVLLRMGTLAVGAMGDMKSRTSLAARSWDELLADSAQPWQLDAAYELDQAAAEGLAW